MRERSGHLRRPGAYNGGMGFSRRKTEQAIQRTLSEEITDLGDERLGFVTITGVSVTPDLARARVRYTVLGDDEVRRATASVLEEAAGTLGSLLGTRVRMRRTPRLEFVYDDAIDHAMRISALLDEGGPA